MNDDDNSSGAGKVPAHIAIVMDGNGRWAKQRHLPVAAGHKAGVETVRRVLHACRDRGVRCLTLFAFSSENWRRPELEVKALMALFSTYLDNEIAELKEKGVQVRFIGHRGQFSPTLLKKIEYAEQQTAKNTEFYLTLAVDYGGQWDIAEAARAMAVEVQQGRLALEAITPETLSSYVCLADLPAPDLMIRTSGEQRISNFLLWQLAYAEFYFTPVLWPDFDESTLDTALTEFMMRDRRYGGRHEDVHA